MISNDLLLIDGENFIYFINLNEYKKIRLIFLIKTWLMDQIC